MPAFRGRLIGLTAILALAITQAHSAWALCCLMDMDSAAVEMVAGQHHAAAPHTSSPAAPDHAPTPECPLGEAGMVGGCAVVAVIPMTTSPSVAIRLDHGEPAMPTDTMPRLLIGTDLFRPPRA